jgi:hypothetical protein
MVSAMQANDKLPISKSDLEMLQLLKELVIRLTHTHRIQNNSVSFEALQSAERLYAAELAQVKRGLKIIPIPTPYVDLRKTPVLRVVNR